jgi:hypothetical protein
MGLDGTIASSRDPAAPSPSCAAVASRRCWLLSYGVVFYPSFFIEILVLARTKY